MVEAFLDLVYIWCPRCMADFQLAFVDGVSNCLQMCDVVSWLQNHVHYPAVWGPEGKFFSLVLCVQHFFRSCESLNDIIFRRQYHTAMHFLHWETLFITFLVVFYLWANPSTSLCLNFRWYTNFVGNTGIFSSLSSFHGDTHSIRTSKHQHQVGIALVTWQEQNYQ